MELLKMEMFELENQDVRVIGYSEMGDIVVMHDIPKGDIAHILEKISSMRSKRIEFQFSRTLKILAFDENDETSYPALIYDAGVSVGRERKGNLYKDSFCYFILDSDSDIEII